MGILGTILAGVGTLAGAGTTVAGIVNSIATRDEAKRAMDAAAAKAANLEAQAKERQSNEESVAKSAAVQQATLQGQRQKLQNAFGRSSTILTGPLGVQGTGPGGSQVSGTKTLLGL